MADFEEKLNSILNDETAMSQIMSLAQSLSGGGDGVNDEAFAQQDENESFVQQPPSSPMGGDLFSMLGNVDPNLMRMGMQLIQEYQGEDDKNARLLKALKPFVKEKRQGNLDKAIQTARISRVVRILLAAMRERGGDEIV